MSCQMLLPECDVGLLRGLDVVPKGIELKGRLALKWQRGEPLAHQTAIKLGLAYVAQHPEVVAAWQSEGDHGEAQ